MANNEQARGAWGSKLGFIVAAAGSAIGLGNIWRFPYVAGQNGGAAFVFIYIFFIVIIGLPVMIAEFSMGRHTQKNPVGAFKAIAPRTPWPWVGGLAVFTCIAALSFYCVIAGFAVGYFVKILLGDFSQIITGAQCEGVFSQFASNPFISIGVLLLFIVLTALIVIRGISAGIERWSKILMPVLFLLLIVLAIRSITLPGATRGLVFYLKPDFSKVTGTTVAQALGQALFSLGVGVGIMITYGSYLSKKDNLFTSAGSVCFFDTLIAFLAGLIMFPALFAMGIDPAKGAGLIFVVLPSIFTKMPGGMVFGAGIFLLISLAALTSTISILEVPVAYFVDEKKWSRKKAVLWMTLAVVVLGVPSAISLGAARWFSRLPFLNMGFLDMMNIMFGNYSLTIGAFFVAVFVSYRWGLKSVMAEIEQEGNVFTFKRIWAVLIRFVCPLAIAVILGYIIITGTYFG